MYVLFVKWLMNKGRRLVKNVYCKERILILKGLGWAVGEIHGGSYIYLELIVLVAFK